MFWVFFLLLLYPFDKFDYFLFLDRGLNQYMKSIDPLDWVFSEKGNSLTSPYSPALERVVMRCSLYYVKGDEGR